MEDVVRAEQKTIITREEYTSSSDVLDCVAECLTSVIHCILYYRGVYPTSSFEKRQLYGVVVPYHRHPKVVEYIAKAVEQTRRVLAKDGRVDLRIPIIDDDDKTVYDSMYRFVFSRDEGDLYDETKDSGGGWYRMYDDVRALVLRLQAVSCCSEMTQYVSERHTVSFRIQLCTQGARDLLDGWMVVGQGEPSSTGRVIPLPSVSCAASSIHGPRGCALQMTGMMYTFSSSSSS